MGVLGGRRGSRHDAGPFTAGALHVLGVDERAGPALLLLSRTAAHVLHERLVARAQEFELVFHLDEPVEPRHAIGPRAQLARRLRARAT